MLITIVPGIKDGEVKKTGKMPVLMVPAFNMKTWKIHKDMSRISSGSDK